jgi:hypothetical protein
MNCGKLVVAMPSRASTTPSSSLSRLGSMHAPGMLYGARPIRLSVIGVHGDVMGFNGHPASRRDPHRRRNVSRKRSGLSVSTCLHRDQSSRRSRFQAFSPSGAGSSPRIAS